MQMMGCLVVTVDSRSKLEKKANSALDKIQNLSEENILRISSEKARSILMKDNLTIKPIVFPYQSILYNIEYLLPNIILDKKLSFKQNLTQVTSKATAASYKIGKGVKAVWGVDSMDLIILFNAC